jgi:hypothetical protein
LVEIPQFAACTQLFIILIFFFLEFILFSNFVNLCNVLDICDQNILFSH